MLDVTPQNSDSTEVLEDHESEQIPTSFFARNKFLAMVGTAVTGAIGGLAFDAASASPAYANCGPCCGPSNCCPSCSTGWCSGCRTRTGCAGDNSRQCWTCCDGFSLWSCCDFYENGNPCSCTSTDGLPC